MEDNNNTTSGEHTLVAETISIPRIVKAQHSLQQSDKKLLQASTSFKL